MGACGSAEKLSPEEERKRAQEKEKNKQVESTINADNHADQAVNKLLLLGAGESGKSTLFKQMIQIYGKGYSEAERKTYIPIIANNILTSIKTLVHQCRSMNPIQDPAYEPILNHVEFELKGDEELDANLAQHILNLWAHPNMQRTYEARSQYQLTDSAQYFFERLNEIVAPGYIPSEQDVLRSRVRTTGIVENEFTIDHNRFKMFDVGGQRNERKKWIHCFENVTAVLFVAAISEYDQVLYEDEQTNRMHEALNLFDEICNSRWFRSTSMILFLNKCDIFAEKLRRHDLANYFTEYANPPWNNDYSIETANKFMSQLFESKNRHAEKQVYTHVTCATDTKNVAVVFDAVKDIVIRKSLEDAGLT